LILTAGRWPWKSEPAKECVTTHLPNQLALKMDGAQVSTLFAPVVAFATTSRWTRRLRRRVGVSRLGAGAGADLGGSSDDSREED
jgi:hypothetical protein